MSQYLLLSSAGSVEYPAHKLISQRKVPDREVEN